MRDFDGMIVPQSALIRLRTVRGNIVPLGNNKTSQQSGPVWSVREYAILNEKLPVILVVEDDDAIQTVVDDALTDGGFEPAIAPSGAEAVTLLKGLKTKYR